MASQGSQKVFSSPLPNDDQYTASPYPSFPQVLPLPVVPGACGFNQSLRNGVSGAETKGGVYWRPNWTRGRVVDSGIVGFNSVFFFRLLVFRERGGHFNRGTRPVDSTTPPVTVD